MTNHLLTSLFISSLAIAGCGGSGGSGVDSAKSVDKLTTDEKIAECDFLRASVDEAKFKKLLCTLDGLGVAGGGCQAAVDACIATNKPLFDTTCAADAAAAQPACASMFTVGEVETCDLAIIDYLNGVAITCTSTQAELEMFGKAVTPAACTAINEKCPELLFGKTEDQGGNGRVQICP